MANSIYQVLRRPLITEKTREQQERYNQFTFEVAITATKPEIREAVASLFKVRVTGVSTTVVRGKRKRTRNGMGKKPNWKKAMVSVHADDFIDLYETV